jgi:addiction module HigA family antidote
LPDGLSGIFFARDLDRANQLDAAGEFSFEAQRRGRPQRVNPATPPPRYWSAAPARRPPCTSVSTSAAAPIFGEVADADVAQFGSPRAEQAPGRSSLSLKMGTRRRDVLRHSGLRLAEVGFVRLAAHCFPVSNRRKCERTNGRRRGVDPLFETVMLRMARACKRSVERRNRGLSLTGKTTMARPAIHPGEILADERSELEITPTELSRQISVPPNRISQIIQGKRAITGDTALRLGHWFQASPQFWLRMVPSVKHLNQKGMEPDTPSRSAILAGSCLFSVGLCPYFAISLLSAEHSLRS